MKGRKWRDEEVKYLREHYYDTPMSQMMEHLGYERRRIYTKASSMKLDRDPKFYITSLQPNAGSFRKGQTPWNKGKKGYMGANPGSFKKGQVPRNWKPVGSQSWRADGYQWTKIEEPNKWELTHRVIWAEQHGPIPKGYNIVFKDGDQKNLQLDNLECISDKEHALRMPIHQYPTEIRQIITLRGALSRQINKILKDEK